MDDMLRVINSIFLVLERTARAQEKLVAIAQESRDQRMALSEQMKQAFKQPIQEK